MCSMSANPTADSGKHFNPQKPEYATHQKKNYLIIE